MWYISGEEGVRVDDDKKLGRDAWYFARSVRRSIVVAVDQVNVVTRRGRQDIEMTAWPSG